MDVPVWRVVHTPVIYADLRKMVRDTEPRRTRAEVEPRGLMCPLLHLLRSAELRLRARCLTRIVGVGAVTLSAPSALHAQSGTQAMTAEALTGTAWNIPTPLIVRLDGERRVMHARYSTRPFEDAPY